MAYRGPTPTQLIGTADPAVLFDYAWAMEPDLRLGERATALDQIEEMLARGEAIEAPPGRDWELELLAERAIDAAGFMRLSDGQAMAERVLAEAGADAALARARATLALGRALTWTGTLDATRRGDGVLAEATELFRRLGRTEWQGVAVFVRGVSVCYQTGELSRAVMLLAEALEILGPDSPRRSSMLTFYADALVDLGRLDAAAAVLDEATEIGIRDDLSRTRAYAGWSRARLAATRDDPRGTERLLREVERDATDWFDTMTGLDFLADAAILLDRVGLTDQSERYLERARQRMAGDGARSADGTPFDEPLRLAEATILARSGDPRRALAKLQELVRGNWLERRLTWRNTLLAAWATLRAGSPEEAGTLAAQALSEAVASGGLAVAETGERLLTHALAPLAEEAGSALARQLLLAPDPAAPHQDGRRLVLRVFGVTSLVSAEGRPLELPAGKAGELVRVLAGHPHGLAVEALLELLCPDLEAEAAHKLLAQALTELRAVTGEVVRREGDAISLVPAWVDLREFRSLARRARAAQGSRALVLSRSALALADRGPLLPGDPRAAWALELRREVEADLARLGPATRPDDDGRPGVGGPGVQPAAGHPVAATDLEDPAVLLERIWAQEPTLALAARQVSLEQLAARLRAGAVPPAPPGRDWQLELLAELAVDASTHVRVEEALAHVEQLRAAPGAGAATLARARASWARGRALAWAGTEAAASEGARELEAAVELFGAIDASEWAGWTRVWLGHTVHYERGRPQLATDVMAQGLALLAAESPYRPTALVFLADAQLETGELAAAEASLDAAVDLADRLGDAKSRSYASWSRAHLAAARDDQYTVERLLAEVERAGGEWFDSHLGVYFLADAAALLDLVGLDDRAQRYLRLAEARGSAGDDYVVLARAVMLARVGDPHQGEAMLAEVVRSEWVEARLRWRNTLLLAWSTLRAGSRVDAGRIAGRALDQAADCGGLELATQVEPLITEALAPLAEEAGSRLGRGLVMGGAQLGIRLFGVPAVTSAGAGAVDLPAGMPGELVRMLALFEYGLPVDAVLELFFPDASPSAGRQRLRQVLSRLRAGAGEIVVRDGEMLRLVPAWVDVRQFRALAQRAHAARGSRAQVLAQAALALSGRGPLLVGDPYAIWAEDLRSEITATIADLTRTAGFD